MKQGVLLSVLASALFALLYYYATVLFPLTGEDIFAWRVILGLPAAAVIITRTRRWREVVWVQRRMLKSPVLFLLLGVAAALVGIQLWLFVWAPIHQRGLDVSLGYFLLPLAMVVVGAIFYKEKLSIMQKVAVACACVGVAHELWLMGGVSWVTAMVVVGYPPYFMLRRYLRVSSISSLWFDFCFLLLPALWIVVARQPSVLSVFGEHSLLLLQVPLLGLISSVALACYFASSRLLPLGLFGILGYVEPVLLFWVAFLLLDEPISGAQWFTYVPIWLAVLCVMLEGGWRWYNSARYSPHKK